MTYLSNLKDEITGKRNLLTGNNIKKAKKTKEKNWFSWFWLIFWLIFFFPVAFIYLFIKYSEKK